MDRTCICSETGKNCIDRIGNKSIELAIALQAGKDVIDRSGSRASRRAKRFALAEALLIFYYFSITMPLPLRCFGGSKPLLTVGQSRRTEQKARVLLRSQ